MELVEGAEQKISFFIETFRTFFLFQRGRHARYRGITLKEFFQHRYLGVHIIMWMEFYVVRHE